MPDGVTPGNVENKSQKGENGAYDMATVMPTFNGSETGAMMYIAQNVVYPKDAKEKNIQGKVFVRFIVDENGKVTNVEIVQGANPLLDAEALRVISTMPAWSPGKDENNKPIKVNLVIPINFALK